jgi:dihydropteroate synthase
MIEAGADILDVGGESTRPGSDPVAAAEEIGRVIPVIEEVRKFSDILLSVDTRKAKVAERALEAGADMVNDISGLRGNRPLAELVAERGVPIVLMHMRGEPKTMQDNPHYDDTVAEILEELKGSVDFALACGIAKEQIIVDPGIGFGKRCRDNLAIINNLGMLRSLGFPVLIGLSRKSFIGTVLDRPVEQRLTGTVVASTLAVLNGADIIRVHDVAEAVDTTRMIAAIHKESC